MPDGIEHVQVLWNFVSIQINVKTNMIRLSITLNSQGNRPYLVLFYRTEYHTVLKLTVSSNLRLNKSLECQVLHTFYMEARCKVRTLCIAVRNDPPHRDPRAAPRVPVALAPCAATIRVGHAHPRPRAWAECRERARRPVPHHPH